MAYVVYVSIYLAPMIYLCFHGWAAKNLLDTSEYDRLAKWLFLVSIPSTTALYIFLESR